MEYDGVEGYRVGRGLGSGSAGSVWLARDLASGRQVVVKRVPVSSVPGAEAFRRDLAVAQGLDHPHLNRLLEVRRLEREWLLISEYVAAGTLTDLLQRRGPLSAGELVTLLSPIAQALGAAHRVGLTHGHLGGGDILFTADGRPVIADLGLRATIGPDDPPTAADDLLALAALARSSGADPRVFPELAFRGEGTAVAQRLLAIAGAEPISLGFGDEPAQADAPQRPEPKGSRGSAGRGSRRAPRGPASPLVRRIRVLAVLALAVLLVGTGAGLALNARQGPSDVAAPPAAGSSTGAGIPTPSVDGTPTPSAEPSPPAASTSATPGPGASTTPVSASTSPGATPSSTAVVAQWTATLRALDGHRARAFATLDPAALDAVYRPGSRPWRDDRTLLASYRSRNVRVDGLRIQILRVAVERRTGAEVVLRVVDRFAGATAVDAAGRRSAIPAGPPTTRLITLTGPAPHYRILAITTT